MESKERQPEKRGHSNERPPEQSGHPSSVKFSLSGSFEDNNAEKPGQFYYRPRT